LEIKNTGLAAITTDADVTFVEKLKQLNGKSIKVAKLLNTQEPKLAVGLLIQ